MMCAVKDVAAQQDVRVRSSCVPDEESEEVDARSTDELVAGGFSGDFAITGEPTDLHIGVQAKGVLAVRLEVSGKAAHGSTPWLGRQRGAQGPRRLPRGSSRCRSPASPRSCSTARRSTSGASAAATRSTRSRTTARWTSTSATCPGRTRVRSSSQIRAIADVNVARTFMRPPAIVSRANPFVRACATPSAGRASGEAMSVGRDGASDADRVPRGRHPRRRVRARAAAGHHGPDEWVSIDSLARYRQALVTSSADLPSGLGASADEPSTPGARGRLGPRERPSAGARGARRAWRAACGSGSSSPAW